MAAIQRVCRAVGVLLDPTYTGKAMAGLLDFLRCGRLPYRRAIFLHTGGEPEFFAGDGEWVNLNSSVSSLKKTSDD